MGNINLMELYKKNVIKKGSHNVNVPIEKASGEKYNGQTYMIPLEYLYYNNQNGRIGVALSEFESENGPLSPGHNEEYNLVIQKMLSDDNDETVRNNMNKLKRDMYIKGQQEVGYVLLDGRVIDGNRRFTAMRLLEQDPNINKQQYYEAVILDDLSVQNHHDQKKIKSLELQIQFGKLEKVDYNPIDRAIDAYKTVSINNVMSAKEYSDFANLTINEVNKRILEAELIVKFLEFSNTPADNYALAKQLDLDGPIQDLIPQYKKFKNNENAQQLLNTLFTKILQLRVTKEDYKQEYRQIIKSVVGTKKEKEFIENMEEVTDIVVDALDKEESVKNNLELMGALIDKDVSQALSKVQKISNQFSETARNNKVREKPILLLDKAIASIQSIEVSVIDRFSSKDKLQILRKLEEFETILEEIRTAGEK